jgi:hypothetical protein
MEEAAARAARHYKRAGWSPSGALENLGVALFYGPTPVDRAAGTCEQLLLEHDGDRASEANLAVWLGALEGMRGKFDEGRALVGRARTIFKELGLEAAAVDTCSRLLATVEMFAGRPESAEAALRESCNLLQTLQQTSALATRAGELAAAMYARGEYIEAARWVGVASNSAGTDDLDAALSWQPVQAMLLAHRGHLAEAEGLARETVASARQTDSPNRQGDSLMVLAAVLAAAERHEEVAALTQEAVRLYDRKGNVVAADRARALLPRATLAE